MVKDQVYVVGVRRIVNRPNTISTERLRFVGTDGERTMWMPEHEGMGTKAVHLTLPMIASLAVATDAA